MQAVQPLPVRVDWAPAWLAPRGDLNRDFAFRFRDAQGAPDASGTRYHGGVDWFAPGGTPVVSPVEGAVVRVTPSRGTSGQVYGGVVTVEGADGVCFVMRHVEPAVALGARVRAGATVALVTRWSDSPGASHLHMEVWRSLAGGYRLENMLDPRAVVWLEVRDAPVETAGGFWFEELPATRGGMGPDVVNRYSRKSAAVARAAVRRTWGERVSVLAGDDGMFYVLRWAPGTYGRPFRFGPWASEAGRDRTMAARKSATGRMMRAFDRRSLSLYPYPMGG